MARLSRPERKVTLLAVLGLAAAGVCFGLLQSSGQVTQPTVSLGGAFVGFVVTVVVLNKVWGDETPRADQEAQRVDSDFIYDEVVKVFDFRGSDGAGPQKVTVDEHYRIQKRSESGDFLVLHYATTGHIDAARSVTHPESYDWQEKSVEGLGGEGHQLQHCYEVKLDLRQVAVNQTVRFSSQIIYLDGFTGADGDWLETIIDYPTRRLTWVVVFPDGKKCRSAVAKERVGRGDWRELRQAPELLHDGSVLYWAIDSPVLSTRYEVAWKWATQAINAPAAG
jgi:hypothetical protein